MISWNSKSSRLNTCSTKKHSLQNKPDEGFSNIQSFTLGFSASILPVEVKALLSSLWRVNGCITLRKTRVDSMKCESRTEKPHTATATPCLGKVVSYCSTDHHLVFFRIKITHKRKGQRHIKK